LPDCEEQDSWPRKDSHNPGYLDTHPLVREYLGEQIRSKQTEAWRECNRRLYHHYRTLAPQLPNSFREMEPLFLAAIWGCNAGLFREVLHEVYIPRIQRGDISFAANVLGARGALLSVLVHFFERGRWGTLVETCVAGQSLTQEDQLFILMQAALFLTATRGHSAQEGRICYERMESLCHSHDRPRLLYSALMGQWRYSLYTDKLSATMQIAERAYSLSREQNDSALKIGAYRALAVTLYFLGDFEAARQNAIRGVHIWRSEGRQSRVEEVTAPAVTCLMVEALSDWHPENLASCQATMAEAISLATELNDMHALAVVLLWATIVGHLERNSTKVASLASHLIELSTRQNFAFWLAGGGILRGWARSASGDTAESISWIDNGIEDWRATRSTLVAPYYLGLKAEALHFADRTAEALEALWRG
jgi:hypothetical protein